MFTLEQFFQLRFRVGVVVADKDGRAVGVNDDLCAIFGRSKEEMLSSTVFDRVSHPADRQVEQPLLDDLLAGRRDRYMLPKRFTRSDGEPINGLVDVALIRDRDGSPATAVGTVYECKQAGDAVYEELRRLLAWRDFLEAELASTNAGLALAALTLSEQGRTRRELATALGVGSSTVHGWVTHARRLKDG